MFIQCLWIYREIRKRPRDGIRTRLAGQNTARKGLSSIPLFIWTQGWTQSNFFFILLCTKIYLDSSKIDYNPNIPIFPYYSKTFDMIYIFVPLVVTSSNFLQGPRVTLLVFTVISKFPFCPQTFDIFYIFVPLDVTSSNFLQGPHGTLLVLP